MVSVKDDALEINSVLTTVVQGASAVGRENGFLQPRLTVPSHTKQLRVRTAFLNSEQEDNRDKKLEQALTNKLKFYNRKRGQALTAKMAVRNGLRMAAQLMEG